MIAQHLINNVIDNLIMPFCAVDYETSIKSTNYGIWLVKNGQMQNEIFRMDNMRLIESAARKIILNTCTRWIWKIGKENELSQIVSHTVNLPTNSNQIDSTSSSSAAAVLLSSSSAPKSLHKPKWYQQITKIHQIYSSDQ